MNKKETIMKQAAEKISTLNFDECIKLYDSIEPGNPMIDSIFDRMEVLDSKRFDEFLDTYSRKHI